MGRSLVASGMAAVALLVPASAQGQALAPGTPPPGANDFDCRRSAERPVPVVLLHGTFGDMTVSFNALSKLLSDRGHCVFALDYGDRATAPLDQSADQIAAFARRVLEVTGASKVSFVGHSQGGLQARYVAKLKGLLDRTEDIVGMAPSNHGTDTPLGPVAGIICDACREQIAGSEQIRRVNEGEEAPPPASYTVISTRYDQVATPYTSQALAGPPERVTNVVLQDRCPENNTEHVFIAAVGPGDPVANQWALNALERDGPANPRFEPDCAGRTLGRDPDAGSGSAAVGTGGRSVPVQILSSRLEPTLRLGRIVLRVQPASDTRQRLSVYVRMGPRGRGLLAGRAYLRSSGAERRRVRVGLRRRARALLRRARSSRHVPTVTAVLSSPSSPRQVRRRLVLGG